MGAGVLLLLFLFAFLCCLGFFSYFKRIGHMCKKSDTKVCNSANLYTKPNKMAITVLSAYNCLVFFRDSHTAFRKPLPRGAVCWSGLYRNLFWCHFSWNVVLLFTSLRFVTLSLKIDFFLGGGGSWEVIRPFDRDPFFHKTRARSQHIYS